MVQWRTVQKRGRRRQLGASSANFAVAVRVARVYFLYTNFIEGVFCNKEGRFLQQSPIHNNLKKDRLIAVNAANLI
jgi:hypothetical protein